MNINYMKLASMFGIGYMLKSIIVTYGQTSENLTANLILLTGCVAIFVASNYVENDDD